MPTFVMAESEAPRATGGPTSSGEAVTHGNSIGTQTNANTSPVTSNSQIAEHPPINMNAVIGQDVTVIINKSAFLAMPSESKMENGLDAQPSGTLK